MNIVSLNVNGIRASAIGGAAAKRGYGVFDFIKNINSKEESKIDIICFQELRVNEQQLAKIRHLFEDTGGSFYFQDDVIIKGHAGVGVLVLNPEFEVLDIRKPFENQEYTNDIKTSGRVIELNIKTDLGNYFTLINAYIHHADSPTVKGISREKSFQTMDNKHLFLDLFTTHLKKLIADGEEVVVVGDFNIAHTNLDIKNYQGNKTKAGFLPEEKAWLDLWFANSSHKISQEVYDTHFYNSDIDYYPPQISNSHFKKNGLGMVDICRKFFGEKRFYSWWTYMGRAFDNDAGWRIDYQIGTPKIARTVFDVKIIKQNSYLERYSDHAPVWVGYRY